MPKLRPLLTCRYSARLLFAVARLSLGSFLLGGAL